MSIRLARLLGSFVDGILLSSGAKESEKCKVGLVNVMAKLWDGVVLWWQ